MAWMDFSLMAGPLANASRFSFREKSKVGPKGKRKMRVSECAGKLIKA